MSVDVSIADAIQRGLSRWKLNVSLLSDEDFVDELQALWLFWGMQKDLFPSLQKWWDAGNEKIKGLAVHFSSYKKKASFEARSLLSNLACHLKGKIDSGVVSCHDAYVSTLVSLAKLDPTDAEAAKVCSRIRWAEDGEASTSYFMCLEKKHDAESWFSALKDYDDNVVTDLNEIMDAWLSFHSKLFSAESIDVDIQSEMLGVLSRSVPQSDVAKCEGLFEPDEVLCALNGMARVKTPGSDGLPVEFFIKFWDTLGTELVDVLNSSYLDGILPSSSFKGLINLIFMKGDCLDLKNWRPITLLNVDYKLCAHTLAACLLQVIYFVVHPDQTCGIQGRYIGENVSLLRDIVDLSSKLNIPAAILSLDKEKAFDRVDWSFLFATLEKMGFGPSFIRWVRLLYSRARCSVLVNGY